MKHIKALSNEKPATAETAFLQWKNLWTGNLNNPAPGSVSPAEWFAFQIESALQK